MPTYTFQIAPELHTYTVVEQSNGPSMEDAIRAWVVAGSGLPQENVIWVDQTGQRPTPTLPGNFATIKLLGHVPVAFADEVEALTDDTRAAGTEIELRVRGLRELPVRVQFFGGTVVGNSTPMELALTTQLALALPSVRSALAVAGLSPFDNGRVQNVSTLVGTLFEGRAVLDLRFYVERSTSEFTGFIETVHTDDYMGPPKLGTAGEIDI